MTRKRQENVKSSVKNGKPFHSKANCFQSKRFREAILELYKRGARTCGAPASAEALSWTTGLCVGLPEPVRLAQP